MNLPQRISVVGTTGSGKSTLAKKIAKKLNLSHVELDSVFHGPNWKSLDEETFQEKIKNFLKQESRWVIDGNYKAVHNLILSDSDTLIWLDYKLPLVLKRVTFRTLTRLFTREELWNGNRESFKNFFHRENVILWALQTHQRNRERFSAILSNPEFAHIKVMRFCNPRETQRWLESLS